MNRIIYLDLIKVVAIFSVIIIHVSAPILYQYGKVDMYYWELGNFYDSLSRMAVPLFLMVTGTLLLNQKEDNLTNFFKKRFFKVLIPLIVWSFIYIFYNKYLLHKNINLTEHVLSSLYTPEYYHLWFLYVIIGIYLFLPIFKIFINNSSSQIQVYFLFLWIITVSVIPLVNKFTNLDIPNHLPMMSGYLGFLLLGYLLSQLKIQKKLAMISILVIIFSTYITFYYTGVNTINKNEFDGFFYENFSLSTILQSIGYFIALKYVGENYLVNNINFTIIIEKLSAYSFGIYLIHPIFIDILRSEKIGIKISVIYGNPIWSIPLTTVITFIISILFIFIIHKIKLIKFIAP